MGKGGAVRYAHATDFDVLVQAVPDAAQILGVDKRTIKRWRSGKSRIPWAAYQLLYEHSHYGLRERDSMEQFQRDMLVAERNALRSKVADLERALAAQAKMVEWGCANDPFVQPTDPRSRIPA